MTAHSVRILSELNMSSFARTQKRTPAFHQFRYQLHSAEGRAKMSSSSSTSCTLDCYIRCWTMQ